MSRGAKVDADASPFARCSGMWILRTTANNPDRIRGRLVLEAGGLQRLILCRVEDVRAPSRDPRASAR